LQVAAEVVKALVVAGEVADIVHLLVEAKLLLQQTLLML
jgi:hypothetical protein